MGWNLLARERTHQLSKIRLNKLRVRQRVEDKFIEACCGKQIVNERALLTSGYAFADGVERRMLEYQAGTAALLNLLFPNESRNDYLERQLEVSVTVTGLLRCSNPRTTIDHIVQGLFASYNVEDSARQIHQNVARHLVFAAIGWASMLYSAVFESPDTDFATSTEPYTGIVQGRRQLAQSSQRPIGAMLRSYGLMPIACPPGTGNKESKSTLLAVTHMNFFSLSTLGDLTISWTNDLSKHCEFDRYSKRKELKLFRLPSMCAMMCLDDNDTLLGQLFRSHTCPHDCSARRHTVAKSYLIEVLLSYRLLFGQHSQSRKLFREKEVESARENEVRDPLLEALCGERRLTGFDSVQSMLRERGVYNAKTDFPHLGGRLVELEDYSTDQRPRNLWDVWNDDRDPERYLTFRVVLVVGALSCFLSVLQVLIALAQLGVAAG